MCPVSPRKVGVSAIVMVGMDSVDVSLSPVEGDMDSVDVLFVLVKEAWLLCTHNCAC